ncbi:hypothetical protein [Liquorilactobacillus oeni]|nr:hypothetical protein [Liquorilactobacillus oeni]
MEETDYQRLYNDGIVALSAGKFQQASMSFTTCYSIKANFRTNYLLFLALTGQGQFSDAFLLAQKYLRDYVTDNERFEQLLSTGAQAKKFVEIRKLYLAVSAYMSDKEKRYFLELINQLEREFVSSKPKIYKSLKKKVIYCGACDLFEQRSVLNMAKSLPFADYLEAAVFLLKDPNVHQLIKVNVLDDLRLLKISDNYDFYFLDHNFYQVSPSTLHAFAASKLYNRFENSFLQKGEDGLGKERWAELRLKLSLLYPFEIDLVSFSSRWQHILLYEKEFLSVSDQKWADRLESSIAAWNV